MIMDALQEDKVLGARLTKLRQLFLRMDADAGEPIYVRMPDGDTVHADMHPGEGLRASGMLLCYALLGEWRTDAREAVQSECSAQGDRALRRACEQALIMTGDQLGFDQAVLYAVLRTASVILPEGGICTELPGLITGEVPLETPDVGAADINARFAQAGDAVILYMDLPDRVEQVKIMDGTYTRLECHAGICLPPGVREADVSIDGVSSHLKLEDPLNSLCFMPGFRVGRLFVPVRYVPGGIWKRLQPVIKVTGSQDELPPLTVTTSGGEIRESAKKLQRGCAWLGCPPLDRNADSCIRIDGTGTRCLDMTGVY